MRNDDDAGFELQLPLTIILSTAYRWIEIRRGRRCKACWQSATCAELRPLMKQYASGRADALQSQRNRRDNVICRYDRCAYPIPGRAALLVDAANATVGSPSN